MTDHPRPPRPRGARAGRGGPADASAEEVSGAGRTALPPDRAVRARDVDRPTAADLARAEAELVLVRRHWTPPAD